MPSFMTLRLQTKKISDLEQTDRQTDKPTKRFIYIDISKQQQQKPQLKTIFWNYENPAFKVKSCHFLSSVPLYWSRCYGKDGYTQQPTYASRSRDIQARDPENGTVAEDEDKDSLETQQSTSSLSNSVKQR